jgi:predicted  nucleic acid-binding Zn-ribbon protein
LFFNSAKADINKIEKQRVSISDNIKELSDKIQVVNTDIKSHNTSIKQIRISTTDIYDKAKIDQVELVIEDIDKDHSDSESV